MPTLISGGAASGKGFGLTNSSLTLTTTTFTSNGTWVAPAGVALVIALTGKGQDGTAGYWTEIYTSDGGYVSYVERSAPAGISSSTIEGRAQTEWDKFPTVHDPNGGTVSWTLWYYSNNQTNQYTRSGLIRLKSGFSKTKTGNGWGTTYTTPPVGNDVSYRVGNMEEYVNPTTGANSSALGYTFNGGVAVPATPVTYNNVAVTPGNSYSIVVPSNGYVTIQYLAP